MNYLLRLACIAGLSGSIGIMACTVGCDHDDDDEDEEDVVETADVDPAADVADASGNDPEPEATLVGTWRGRAGSPPQDVVMTIQLMQDGSECGQSSNTIWFDAILRWPDGEVWRASDYNTMKCGERLELNFEVQVLPGGALFPIAGSFWQLIWDGHDNLAGRGVDRELSTTDPVILVDGDAYAIVLER